MPSPEQDLNWGTAALARRCLTPPTQPLSTPWEESEHHPPLPISGCWSNRGYTKPRRLSSSQCPRPGCSGQAGSLESAFFSHVQHVSHDRPSLLTVGFPGHQAGLTLASSVVNRSLMSLSRVQFIHSEKKKKKESIKRRYSIRCPGEGSLEARMSSGDRWARNF